jgi:pyruvate dehydrogenase E1 component
VPMVPFFIFYSMFGFQRVGDLIWQAADHRAKGFLLGATAGRTTLLGEGLQHQDGHSHVLASTVPVCRAYDPAFAYEVAALVRHGIGHMYGPDAEDVFYYLTLYNENHPMPAMPDGAVDGIVEGLYRWREAPEGTETRASILFSGTAHLAATAAQAELAEQHGIGVDLWSAPGWKQLREEALATERWNRLHPAEAPRLARVAQLLGEGDAPVVAVTDYMAAVPDQISRWVRRPYTTLGTDGFGRSDTREELRRFFEIDAGHVVVAVLSSLARAGRIDPAEPAKAAARHGIDPDIAPSWVR